MEPEGIVFKRVYDKFPEWEICRAPRQARHAGEWENLSTLL
jgi:hypothetical protein